MLIPAELKGCITWFISFLDLLWVTYKYAKFHHCRICVTDLGRMGAGGGHFCSPPPSHPWASPKNPILNSVKVKLTGNKINIANYKVYRFSNSFQHIKNEKNPAKWYVKYICAYNLRTGFCKHKVFGRTTKATMVHHLTPKKAQIDGWNFFQNPHWWFISEHFWVSLTNPNSLSRDIGNFIF